ncbi:unnamed protein product [Rhizoctonia solani]|uniref:Protein kinase domain-containing protein n=1 Tax=Rhizoctonia solani TaxID=456999 RepID=A0A8H3D9F1_9AGAM|nr:unnamed protein product [Rhizoctonia solani]
MVLGQHNCSDVTSNLMLEDHSQTPIMGGGEAEVFQAICWVDGSTQPVAIKRRITRGSKREPGALKAVAKELYVWSKCHHNNVLPLLGLARFRGQIAMVSPFIQGGCLRNYVLEHPTFNRLNACLQIGEGLTYLHSVDIVHGDLKAANVLITADGIIQLTDFGSSLIKNHSLHFSSKNEDTVMTPNWTAPEATPRSSTRTKMSDVYAYGMVWHYIGK